MKLKYIHICVVIGMIGLLYFNSCVNNEDYSTPPVPPEGFFKETFDQVTKADGSLITGSPWPKISTILNFDNDSPVTYTDPSGRSDIRFVNSINSGTKFVWIPYNNGTPASLIIDNLPTSDKTNITLRYKFNDGGVYNAGTTSDANVITLTCNDVQITVPSIKITTSNGANKFIIVKVIIPDGTTKIKFSNTTKNGLRIDDIELIQNYPW